MSVETQKFYKALSQVGTDFSLMGPLFPSRKRRELKVRGYFEIKKISVECCGVHSSLDSSLSGVTALCSWARHYCTIRMLVVANLIPGNPGTRISSGGGAWWFCGGGGEGGGRKYSLKAMHATSLLHGPYFPSLLTPPSISSP